MSLALSYSRALLEAGKDKGLSQQDLLSLGTELQSVSATIFNSPILKRALMSPVTESAKKVNIVEELLKTMSCSGMVSQLVRVMTEKGRLKYLPQISASFDQILLESAGGLLGHLVSADPMSESDLADLRNVFSTQLNKKVQFKVAVDPELMAGLKVTINGVTYDGSLKAQLKRLKSTLISGNA